MALGVGVGERIGDTQEAERRAMENITDNMRVAMPGEIVTFDAEKQTATVQPLIKEKIRGDWKSLPQLLDVPCFFPRAGGYCLTFPVKPKDEVIILFNDMCLDAWWQSSGQQTQLETRRHDLSDAMCLLGITSVPRKVKDYSKNSVQLRNEDNDSYFEIVDNKKTINIICAETVNITANQDINVTANKDVNITAAQKMNLQSGSDMNIQSGTHITMKAPRIDFNPPDAGSGAG